MRVAYFLGPPCIVTCPTYGSGKFIRDLLLPVCTTLGCNCHTAYTMCTSPFLSVQRLVLRLAIRIKCFCWYEINILTLVVLFFYNILSIF